MTDKQIAKKRIEFGKLLKQMREEKGLKITEAAAILGISHQNLANLETGRHFNFPTVCKVASYYELEIGLIQKAV